MRNEDAEKGEYDKKRMWKKERGTRRKGEKNKMREGIVKRTTYWM